VAHTCNPSYSGGRGQEDHSSKPAQANSSQNPTSQKKKKKYPTQNRAVKVAQVVKCLPSKREALSSKPQYCQNYNDDSNDNIVMWDVIGQTRKPTTSAF
jgi:hypothetical protein